MLQPHGQQVRIKVIHDFQGSDGSVTYIKDSEHLVGVVTADALLLAGIAVKIANC